MIFKFYHSIKDTVIGNKAGHEVVLVDHSRIQSLCVEIHDDPDANDNNEASKRKCKFNVSNGL